MIAVDTNVLVYAHVSSFAKHASARRRLTELAEGDACWGLPVFCLGEFLRVVTHPKLLDPPLSSARAKQTIERILASPSLQVLMPGERYPALLFDAVVEGDAIGNLVFDAQIVAVCRELGVRTLLTEDRDFDRFRDFPVERLAA